MTKTIVYPAYKLQIWWPAICQKCNWRGLTEQCPHPSDFDDDVVCPKCKNIVSKDPDAIAEGDVS